MLLQILMPPWQIQANRYLTCFVGQNTSIKPAHSTKNSNANQEQPNAVTIYGVALPGAHLITSVAENVKARASWCPHGSYGPDAR